MADKSILATEDLDSTEVLAELCARLANGETTRSMTRGISASFERKFWKKMADDQVFAATIARAREAGQDALTAETIDIADGATEETVNSAKLRIWARQWYASKLSPKKYGDKVAVDQNTTHHAGDTLTEMMAKLRNGPAKSDA